MRWVLETFGVYFNFQVGTSLFMSKGLGGRVVDVLLLGWGGGGGGCCSDVWISYRP